NIELPTYKDEAYSTYLETLKAAIAETDKVQFEDGASLGIYSFYKMNMYNDLISHKEMVLKNKNIRALLGEPDSVEILDEKAPVYPVVNCDSSQLDAIQNAANGKSFCLQGPPGSGKSQTITNMISTFLGQEKKILFVSEKIAALNVVFENLRRAKLSEFALELHSNKANKKEFIDKLYTAATLPRYEMNLRTKVLESKYRNLQQTLASYERELHEIIPGLDACLLDLYSMYLGNDVDELDITLDIEGVNLFSLDKSEMLFRDYTIYSEYIGDDYRKSGLYGLNLDNISNLGEISADLAVALKHIATLMDVRDRLNNSSLGKTYTTVMEIYNAMALVESINKIKNFSPYFFVKATRQRIQGDIERYLTILPNLKCDAKALYNDGILSIDLEKTAKLIEDNNKGLFKNAEFKDAMASALKYRKAKEKPEEIVKELRALAKYKRYYDASKSYTDDLNKYLGDWTKYDLKQINNDCNLLATIPDMKMDRASYDSIKEDAKYIPGFSYFKTESLRLISAAKIFYKKDIDLYATPLEIILQRLEDIYAERDYIYNYQELMKIIQELKEVKCLDFLNQYLDEGRPVKDISKCYNKTFIKQKIKEIHIASQRLSEFSSMAVDDIINEFRDLDERMLQVNRDYIIAVNSVKRQSSLVEGSQFKLLDKEYNKLRRQLPIRSLLEKTFELALDVKPVFLMSPLSVSTYLASELDMFDVVIFDEASQIFACDAFGSIYRGKQCIVIGDTKQMPPTSFFQASAETIGSQVEEEVVEEEEYDLESILDKASNTFDTKSLKWHYRSRTEELIVFSNNAFYDSNLITIPQSRHHEKGFGIDFYYIKDGLYDAQTRTNPIEAQTICDMVFEHLDTSTESVGVVAFSNVQAELIQSLIDKRLKKEPKYEKYFDPELEEPVFVKNLESVQGDERDRIIFSICYAYNKDGKFYQRFGPINASGGERRLNVAITRAKINISIVSSIKYSDIRDNPDSQGVTQLKKYLQFAENVVSVKNYSEDDSGTIKAISEYIESLGYVVVPNYGSSAFKVDLAVRKDEDFILAIMIDGNNSYSTSLTDNYRLERMLLERQGWRYYKLFTTAWINDQEIEKMRIKQALEGTLVEGIEYERHTGEVSFLKAEGNNEDAIDMSFTTYDYLQKSKGAKLYNHDGMPYLVKELIRVESPIHKDYLYKRIADILDYPKVTDELKAEVDNSMPDRLLKIGDFIFNFRVSDLKLRLESDRDVQYICTEELADGLYNIILKNNGISEAGAFKTIVNMLGQQRVTAQSKNCLLTAKEHLILDHKVEERDEKLYIIR
ncbi:MAG: hypothetical protein K6A63_08685, partial [Acholeplasmatales bacterium]|nr:hypothetical protein [Acholeplasmatales bacterium]